MSVETLRGVLLWCTILNLGVLLVWGLVATFAAAPLYRLWGRWFRMSREAFDAINFCGIIFYKSLTLLFNLMPLIALHIVR